MKKTITLILVFTTTLLFSQVPNYVPTNGLVGWWPFTGNANDMSGNGNNGTASGATLTPDRFGNNNSAYNFDGVNDYIETSMSNLPLNNSARSFSFFYNFQTSQSNNWNCILSYGNSVGTNNPGKLNDIFVGSINSSFIYLNNNEYTTIANTNQNFSNSWHHIVLTYDGISLNDIKIYFDGIQLQTSTQNFQSISSLSSTLSTLFFGKTSMSYTGINYFYSGKIDDIGIWNRALTQQEITNLYNASLSTEDFVINSIDFYPNPTTSLLNFKSAIQVEQILIYNMLGQLVQQEKVNALEGTINIEKLVQGTYLVKVNDIDKGYTIIKN